MLRELRTMSFRLCLSTLCTIPFLIAEAMAEVPLAHQVETYLRAVEPDYDARHHMLGTSFNSPGYHSRVPDGTWVHPTRQSLDYAGALLARNAEGDAQRAALVVRKVLSLQDTDPAHATFGIWPWLLEEPLDQMSPPDWNWADFCGARLALMLHDDSDRLPEDLQRAMQQSVKYASRAIRRRDVQPGYTNIAIMGGGVCAAVGELTDDQQMLRYGRERLQRTVQHAVHHGGFNEYNSPTYTMVALRECERTLHLVRDPPTREAAEALRRIAWQTIADSFHPVTGQWAGPHSRAYDNHLSPSSAAYLAEQTGADIPVHPTRLVKAGPRMVDLFPHLPCPPELCSRFQRLPDHPLELRRTFTRDSSGDPTVIGTTWLSGDACLGSVNRSTFWTQRRVLIGYWKTKADRAVVFRMRFLHDGRDFASIGATIQQLGPRAVIALVPLRKHGDWHVSLDRPKDGIFRAQDLRMRFELSGEGTAARTLDGGRFELSAGSHRVVIHTLAGRFDGQPVRWESGRAAGKATVDGVCYHGAERVFDFRSLTDVAVGAGVELLAVDQPIARSTPTLESAGPATVHVSWDLDPGLLVTASFAP